MSHVLEVEDGRSYPRMLTVGVDKMGLGHVLQPMKVSIAI